MTEKQEKFINDIAYYVCKYASNYDICVVSPIIAQAILESNWGDSTLAYKYHNYFGMKCGSKWQGKSVNLSTGEQLNTGAYIKVKSDFRVYNSLEEGIIGYFEFIQLERYHNLRGIKDPNKYLETIKSDGYATSINYVKNLMNVINMYGLTVYDKLIAKPIKEVTNMAMIIGSARSNEYGKATGGKAGDQKSGAEVSTQTFYVHDKGWYVLRLKSAVYANAIAERMKTACNNNHIGYCQDHRFDIIKYGIDTKVNIECDCSTLVRQCIIEATGKDPGNFTTFNEVTALQNTGLFEKTIEYKPGMTTLYDGDILVTKTKGHTAIVVSGNNRTVIDNTNKVEKPTEERKSNDEIAKEVIDGKWGSGETRKSNLRNAGYDADLVQQLVNELLGYNKEKGYYPKCDKSYTSIVDALISIGEPVNKTTYSYRLTVAKANNIPTVNSYNMNNSLLKLLKEGKLKRV